MYRINNLKEGVEVDDLPCNCGCWCDCVCYPWQDHASIEANRTDQLNDAKIAAFEAA